MAPNKELEKAEKERESCKITIAWLEKQLAAHPTTPIPVTKVENYLKTVAINQTRIEDTFHRIVSIVDPADVDPHSAEYMVLLDRAIDLEYQFGEIKKACSSIPSSTSGSTSTAGTHHASDIRLPRINLPMFDGKIEDWTSFRDMFQTAIHTSTTLSDAQKLTYLKAQLKGEAARQVQSLNISDANYAIAWKQLTERYQSDRQLLFALLNKLTQQQQVVNPTASSLRHLIDVSKECIRSLQVLSQPVDQWDSMLLFLIYQKLDASSRELYEHGLKDSSIPKLQGLFDFLEQRSRALEASGSPISTNKLHEKVKHGPQRNQVHLSHSPQNHQTCKACNETWHPLFKCAKFLTLKVTDRFNLVRKYGLCFNCLRHGHPLAQCPSSSTCRVCSVKHHTLLHITKDPAAQPLATGVSNDKPLTLNHHTKISNPIAQTLLATSMIRVRDDNNQYQLLRILLDGGSDTHIISSKCIKRLGLRWRRNQALVTGLSMTPVGTSPGELDIELSPHFDPNTKIFARNVRIMPTVTASLPLYPCRSDFPHLSGLLLADEKWNVPNEIDMLIGAGLFYGLLGSDKRIGESEEPLALSSELGWLVVGEVGTVHKSNLNVHASVSTGPTHVESQPSVVTAQDVDLDLRLRSFWELESVPTTPILTAEEAATQLHYQTHTTQAEDGRFVVRLPFRTSPPDLGDSRDIAIQRLKYIERRLVRNPTHKDDYIAFMREYRDMGHMRLIPTDQIHQSTGCYIPHHFILKESSTTTKLRVVFDASCKTTNGRSLNDELMIGPTVQDPLFNILIRFRTHRIAFTADIEKMYRQILIHPDHTNYQRIVWRDDPSQQVQDFILQTVTYGTAPAPYLATETLQHHARNHLESFPLASQVALRDFYVDDLMSGADDEATALQTQSQLLRMMKLAQFCLRKWTSNCPAILNALPEDMKETKTLLPMELDHTIKALGIYWKPQYDHFIFKISLEPGTHPTKSLTKRIILSEIAKIFDPIGWLAPVVITAKITMQSLWKLQLGWDDPVPAGLQDAWISYKTALKAIETLQIPRCVKQTPHCQLVLIGFCDASELAYAAVVYLCVYPNDQSQPLISLIASKTRVAPTKTVSIPRLELCGAFLLANLMESVLESLNLNINHQFAYTDSTTTLAWIQSHPSRWKRFVAHRVTEIQNRLPPSIWRHVSGVDNPADCASRGVNPEDLASHSLWWNGPAWLGKGLPTVNKPSNPVIASNILEKEEQKEKVCNTARVHSFSPILQNCSSLLKLTRITGWIFRFANNCRSSKSASASTSTTGPLLTTELECAMLFWIRIIQQYHFHSEIKSLSGTNPSLHPKSKILSLNPFLDKDGLLRVGGRLKHAPLSHDQRHPILLPHDSRLTRLLIRNEHQNYFHAGPQFLLASLQSRYWIIHGRNTIRLQLRKCVRCTRLRATTMQQLMGDLPAFRVTPSRPFLETGVDYAGPFLLRPLNSRSTTTTKCYLCLFVCCSTRAVHLELASDLTSSAFLAALRRFVSRRGRPSDIYSDHGTNFVGAARELRELLAYIGTNQHNEEIANQLSSDGIQWHWIPPGAPNFGGLWEAGVKSVKYHLKRVMGTTRLTFEELTTTLTQVEAILNSRPLTAESSDPGDLSALTPGHFLIGGPLTAAPDANVTELKIGRLSRWQLVQHMYQTFWKRWSAEFLTRLQQRPKWMGISPQIKIGDLVVIKDERLPPLTWNMGRVIEVHPGADGLIRVATLKTQSGTLKRPISKLCRLPTDPDQSPEN